MTELYNRTQDLSKRRRLRRESTPAEKILWEELRDRKLWGYKFRRQYSIDRFVVDFYCPQAHLAIELDGGIHENFEVRSSDIARQNHLEASGIHFLRFTNTEINQDLPLVLKKITQTLQIQ